MHVMFVTVSMGNGGVERLLSNLIPELLHTGIEVTLVTNDGDATDYYPLPEQCRRIRTSVSTDSHGLLEAAGKNLRKLGELRRVIKSVSPDIVVSCMTRTNVRVLTATLGLPVPVIASEHGLELTSGVIWKALQRLTYRRARKVVCVSKGMSDTFAYLGEGKATHIYNVIKTNASDAPPLFKRTKGVPRFLSMGRLTEQKNQALLLSSFKLLTDQYPHAELWLLGSGPLEAQLKKQCLDLGIINNVKFAGHAANPFSTMAEADAFVLSSDYEGFGNVLVEAMLLGTPVVSTDCPYGPAEIIDHGRTGWLVPMGDEIALWAKMSHVLDCPDRMAEVARTAQRDAQARFSTEAIVRQWLALFQEVGEQDV